MNDFFQTQPVFIQQAWHHCQIEFEGAKINYKYYLQQQQLLLDNAGRGGRRVKFQGTEPMAQDNDLNEDDRDEG